MFFTIAHLVVSLPERAPAESGRGCLEWTWKGAMKRVRVRERRSDNKHTCIYYRNFGLTMCSCDIDRHSKQFRSACRWVLVKYLAGLWVMMPRLQPMYLCNVLRDFINMRMFNRRTL